MPDPYDPSYGDANALSADVLPQGVATGLNLGGYGPFADLPGASDDMARSIRAAMQAVVAGVDPNDVHPSLRPYVTALSLGPRPAVPSFGLLGPIPAPSSTARTDDDPEDDADGDADADGSDSGAAGGDDSEDAGASDSDDIGEAAAALPARAKIAAIGKTAPPDYPRSLDPTIESIVAEYNRANDALGDETYLDPDFIKAMIRTEAGYDMDAYMFDPMQVNKPGDWPVNNSKADYGLQKGVRPGAALSIRAGISWLTKSPYRRDSRGNDTGQFRGWRAMVRAYNGGRDPDYMQKFDRHLAEIKAGR
jgi:hypothetical protein